MIEAPLPPDEEARLDALVAYATIQDVVRANLDALTQFASELCGTPIALVSMIDAAHQSFWSRYGLDAESTPRSLAFCAHGILQDDLFEIPDAHLDVRFHDNPLVTGAPHVRYYVGAPLETFGGHKIGMLCAIDHVPRRLDDVARRQLRVLADQVVTQLELALRIRQTDALVAERERQNAELEKFAYRVSHDLKAPVLRLQRLAEIAIDDLDEGELGGARESITRSVDTAARLGVLISDILDLTRARGVDGPLESTDLTELGRELEQLHAFESGAASVALRVMSCGGTVQLPRGRLRQIASNLISNAIKYRDGARDDAFASVEVALHGDRLRLIVADNGVGIPSEHHDRAFEMFERIHPDRAEGTGLGMAIVRSHVEAMRGSILMNSEPGVGTTVQIEVPLERGATL